MEPVAKTPPFEKYRRYYRSIGGFMGESKTNVYTGTVFTFLAVSLFGWYAIRPTLDTILLLRREIADNQLVSTQMEDKISKLIVAQATYQNTQTKLSLLSEALPPDPHAIMVAKALRTLANVSNASISAISIGSNPVIATPSANARNPNSTTRKNSASYSTKIEEVPINITAIGSFTSLKTFLDGMLAMRRILTLVSMSFIPESDASIANANEATLRMTLRADMHYMTHP